MQQNFVQSRWSISIIGLFIMIDYIGRKQLARFWKKKHGKFSLRLLFPDTVFPPNVKVSFCLFNTVTLPRYSAICKDCNCECNKECNFFVTFCSSSSPAKLLGKCILNENLCNNYLYTLLTSLLSQNKFVRYYTKFQEHTIQAEAVLTPNVLFVKRILKFTQSNYKMFYMYI